MWGRCRSQVVAPDLWSAAADRLGVARVHRSVAVKAMPDSALGNCVAGAMQKPSFGKTQNGGSLAYRWNF